MLGVPVPYAYGRRVVNSHVRVAVAVLVGIIVAIFLVILHMFAFWEANPGLWSEHARVWVALALAIFPAFIGSLTFAATK